MPFQRPTLQELNNRIKADFAIHYNEGKPLSPRSLPSVLATTIAGAAHMLHGHIDSIANEIFPDTCSTKSLERMAHIRGIYRRPGENHDDLLRRYILRLKNPMCGGTRKDFEQMAKQVESVKNVWVTENVPEDHKVNICFTTSNPDATLPSPELIEKVTQHLELHRPLLTKINVFPLAPYPIEFQIQLNPGSEQLKTAIEKSLKRLIFEEAKPGGIIRHSHILLSITKHLRRERGETFTLLSPTEDVVVADSHIATFGQIQWERG